MNLGERSLSAEALDGLLRCLDDDREAAGEKYVLLRRKLVRFFEWRGAGLPDDCADRTLNVAAQRMNAGEDIRNLSSYCGGIAKMILMEERRGDARERVALTALASAPSAEAPDIDESRQRAFEECLRILPTRDRELILGYYEGDGRARIAARERMARELGIPMNALRIRACRIRARLEQAMSAAMTGLEDQAKHNDPGRHEKVRVP